MVIFCPRYATAPYADAAYALHEDRVMLRTLASLSHSYAGLKRKTASCKLSEQQDPTTNRCEIGEQQHGSGMALQRASAKVSVRFPTWRGQHFQLRQLFSCLRIVIYPSLRPSCPVALPSMVRYLPSVVVDNFRLSTEEKLHA
jgi:hypothetical protein